MSSRHETPIDHTPEPSITASGSALPNAFGRMMQGGPAPAPKRDRCMRPEPTYNHNYDPFKAPPDTQPKGYSPFVHGEPLFDDREVIITRLPARHIVAGASSRPRTSWVWKLGYTLTNTSKTTKNTIWACKLCTLSS
jgi:hypothetical protein